MRASAAFADAFTRGKLTEVLAYTAPDNLRSQAVMARLKMTRDASRDFTATYPGKGRVARIGVGGEGCVR
jgi:RimJ/RimL family protein N-acetyltransferase